MSWTGKEANEATPPYVASQISSLRDDDLASDVETNNNNLYLLPLAIRITVILQ